MFGAFDLKPGIDAAKFQTAFDAFCRHLKEQGYNTSWRMWKRSPHDGYDNGAPNVAYLLEMTFHSHQASLDCWDYVERDEEPLKSLHRAVNQKVIDAKFALYQER